ncbi:hypothetical protein [Candidatus Erwinia haradaeae]|uniref:hypothetical protein n=1 Tax=Candidatus Erwinia haradaeae TaxID=1922217 RepID=UPI00138FC0CD|nr:hypothetical protein [Candidatus Erwinia haradaeae]
MQLTAINPYSVSTVFHMMLISNVDMKRQMPTRSIFKRQSIALCDIQYLTSLCCDADVQRIYSLMCAARKGIILEKISKIITIKSVLTAINEYVNTIKYQTKQNSHTKNYCLPYFV